MHMQILTLVMNRQTCITHVVSSLNHQRHRRRRATLSCQPPPPARHHERAPPSHSKQIAGNYAYTLRGTSATPLARPTTRLQCVPLCCTPGRGRRSQPLARPAPCRGPCASLSLPSPPRRRPRLPDEGRRRPATARAHHSHVVYGLHSVVAAWRQFEFCRASDIAALRTRASRSTSGGTITLIEVNLERCL